MLINENMIRQIMCSMTYRKLKEEDRATILQIAAHTHRQVARAVNNEDVSDFLLERVQYLLNQIYRGKVCSEITLLSEPIMSVMSSIMWMLGLNEGRDVEEGDDFEAIFKWAPMEEKDLGYDWAPFEISRLKEMWDTLVGVYRWEMRKLIKGAYR